MRSGFALILGAGVGWLAALLTGLVPLGVVALLLYAIGLAFIWNCFAPRESTPIQQRWLFRLARLSLLITPLVILQPSPDPQVLGYYGSVWVFIIAAQLAETLLIIYLALRPPPLTISANVLRLLLLILFGGFSAALVFITLYRGDPHNILAAVWLVGLYPALLWVAFASASGFQPRILSSSRLWLLACAALIAVGVGVSLLSLRTFPNFMNTDEPWTLSYADTTDRTGLIYATMFPVDQIPVRSSPRIYYLLNAWMHLIGQRDIYAARAFSLLAGFLLLPVIFIGGRALYDSRTALLAALLLAISILWIAVSHIARPEMWLTLAVWSGVALLAIAQRRRSSRYSAPLAFAGGLVLALSAELHLFGAVYCLIIGIWRLALVRSWRAERWQLAALIVGGGVGALFFASYHLLPDPGAFSLGFNNERSVTGGLADILEILVRRYQPYFVANPIEFLFLLGASLYAVVLRDRARIGVIALLSFVFYALAITDPNMYYVMVWLPALILLTASTIRSLKWSAQVAVALILISIFSVTALRVRAHLAAGWNERALLALETAAAHVPPIPPDRTVVGQPLLYLGLRNEHFISYAYVSSQYPDQEGLSGLAVIRPCYLITHDQDWIFNGAPQILSSGAFIDLPGTDGDLEPSYHTIDMVDTGLGTFRIWQRSADGCNE